MKNKIIIILIIVVLVLVGVLLFSLRKQPLVSVSSEGHMESTPVEVEQIRAIGEWEFLTVSDEEIVDTVRHGFFGDDELSRIFFSMSCCRYSAARRAKGMASSPAPA